MEPFPQIRLAHLPGTPSDNCLLGRRGVPKLPERLWPSLLLSYHFIRNTPEVMLNYAMRSWVLDSGAFSAMNSGADMCSSLTTSPSAKTSLPARDRPKRCSPWT
jgi:hypothetical protein